VDLPLIRKVAKTKKPIIMSTGMASVGEIEDAVQTVFQEGGKDIILLKCTSTYPAAPTDTNLLTVPHMKNLFHVHVGLSDHTLGIGVSVAAVALGAAVIEKHFTLDRKEGGVDSAFSLEPHELKSLVSETERAWQALGDVSYGATVNERKSLQFRKSIYISESLKSGEVLTSENLRIIRPGFGLPPKFFPFLIGKKISKSVEKGTPMSWDLLC
jgi:N-acetylneuraminate synthase